MKAMDVIDISFIVPVYNCAKYIEECVESIFSCDDCNHVECILVDDGSTDGSNIICDGISKKILQLQLYIKRMVGYHRHETVE